MNLPYGVFTRPGERPRVGVGIGDQVLDLAGLAEAGRIDDHGFATSSLNTFMAAGPTAWSRNRARLRDLLADRPAVRPHLFPRKDAEMLLPFRVADFVDFYAFSHHGANLGRILRPGSEPLLPNWRHLPVGYHGRSGTVVVSGTPIVRPCGQRLIEGKPSFGPSRRLDFEAEIGFVVGVPSKLGQPVDITAFRDHVFGLVLVNDWSARDIQGWEYQPLGPFLGKSFATSISPWVVPLAALEASRVPSPAQHPEPLPYLRTDEHWGLDITLEIELNSQLLSRPPVREMYWTMPQQLAHATSGGAALRTGDLFASGTVSGPTRAEHGSLIEITWNGERPIELPDGRRRSFLEDGDTVRIRASAPGADGTRIGFGDLDGTIVGNDESRGDGR